MSERDEFILERLAGNEKLCADVLAKPARDKWSSWTSVSAPKGDEMDGCTEGMSEPLCPSNIHMDPVPATVTGTYAPDSFHASRVSFCELCAETGKALRLFIPDAT